MEQTHAASLKEVRSHGTQSFPCAVYQTRAVGKGTLVRHHWHDEVEILYFLGGNFRLNINMESFPVTSECIYFINPGELHSIVTETAGSPGEDAVLFHPDILSFDQTDAIQVQLIQPVKNARLFFPRCIFPGHPAFEPVRQSFYAVMQAFGCRQSETDPPAKAAVTDDLTSQLLIKSALLRIFAELYGHRLFTAAEKNYDDRIESIKTALAYMRERYQEKIYIRDLAKQVNMNDQYFCRLFKRTIGRSPIEYLNEYRIKQAKRLLTETSLSVTEICLDCGFYNLGNFMREFKKITNTTPLQYRKKNLP